MNTNSMKAKDLVAYALIAIGVVALLGRLSGGAGWLWVGLVAIGFLWAWVAQKSYGFLVTGSILAGVAVGILLESSWGWNGAFLISLGIGFIMIDRLETRQNKWPLYVGAVLAVLGLVIGVLETGFLGSFWFALLLIGVGVYLLTRGQGSDPTAGWVKVEPHPTSPSSSYSPSSTETVSSTPAATTNEVSPSFSTNVNDSGVNDSGLDSSSSDLSITPSHTVPSNTVSSDTVPSDVAQLREPLPLEYDHELYTRLETWRRETARAEDRAAYLILTNDTMQKIAATKPQTVQELLEIKGIGEVKLERYGEALLKIIRGES